MLGFGILGARQVLGVPTCLWLGFRKTPGETRTLSGEESLGIWFEYRNHGGLSGMQNWHISPKNSHSLCKSNLSF